MRIRIWTAFASNNSGSYTIVGSFASADAASTAAEALATALSEHHAYTARPDGESQRADPPFHRFVREQGLTLDSEDLALGDDWPHHGPAPEVVALDTQVLVHVDYTVTMPRTLGEFFFRRGGRVDVEINHAHHPVACLFQLWVPSAWEPEVKDEAKRRLDALKEELAVTVLPPLVEWSPEYHRRPSEPAWGREWSMLVLGVVFPDLARGVAEVSRVARERGVSVRVRVFEPLDEAGDPLAAMRAGPEREPGAWQAVLWDPRDDRLAVLKAVREIAGLSLAEVRERLADLPCVVLDRVGREDAEEAVEKLRALGADAEAIRPARSAASSG
jgi:ribosomal protein L7/L12